MASYVATEEELTAVADAIREKGGTQAQLEWPDGYVDAIDAISGDMGMPQFEITWYDDWSDVKEITCNMTYSECHDLSLSDMRASIFEHDESYVDAYYTPASHYRNYTSYIVYTALSGSYPAYDLRYNSDGSIVFVEPSAGMGTAGTPTATKGSVSNHSVSVTPSVTNTTGYITGDTKTGTAVTVSASELVSGTLSITSSGTHDVTNYASVDVDVAGSSYTATISGTGDSTYCYARVNDTGSRYYADGSTFTFTDTDEIVFHCSGSRGGGTITLNGAVVAQDAYSTASYTLASPRTDMAINMSYGPLSSIDVTVPELSITENGRYDVSGYARAMVNVSGGGGPTKIATKSLGTISTTNTTATDTGQTLAITGFDAYDLLICIAHTSPHTNGRHVATVRLLSFAATSNVNTKTSAVIATSTQHYKLSSSGVLSERTGTTAYGVYVSAGTISTSGTRTLTLTISQRYNSTSTGTINGNYVLDVYGVSLQDLL